MRESRLVSECMDCSPLVPTPSPRDPHSRHASAARGQRSSAGVRGVFGATTLALLALLALGCRKQTDERKGEASQAASAAPSTTASAPRIVVLPGGTGGYVEGKTPELFHIPVGPRLAIIPGQGIGPVRFGATFATVERLLDVKCSERTETLCRIMSHATDFVFKDGVVEEMRLHGEERPFSDQPNDTYGIFNGRFLKGATLGMYAKYVQESVGEPKRVEKFETPPPGRFPTVERHHYDDMVLEYDRLKNGNVVLAGVILTRPAAGSPNAPGAASAAPSAAKPTSSTAPKPNPKGGTVRSPH
jgi:hypothetical protein